MRLFDLDLKLSYFSLSFSYCFSDIYSCLKASLSYISGDEFECKILLKLMECWLDCPISIFLENDSLGKGG